MHAEEKKDYKYILNWFLKTFLDNFKLIMRFQPIINRIQLFIFHCKWSLSLISLNINTPNSKILNSHKNNINLNHSRCPNSKKKTSV